MQNIIYTFFLGLSFTMGAVAGIVLTQLATKKGREGLAKDVMDHNNRVEDRLAKYVEHTARIATAVEVVAKVEARTAQIKREGAAIGGMDR